MAETKIEWATHTWNPVTGCSKVSPGCAHCYAETFAERWRGIPGHPYEQGFDVRLWPERLEAPLRWRRPRMVFVNSMSDLFHEQIPDEFIAEVFEVMAAAPQHTFQVLTKRPERMRDWFRDVVPTELGPLRNVWAGVTIENRRFVHRADVLRETPAAVRFVSAEPLLGPLLHDLQGFTHSQGHTACWTEWADGYLGPELDLTDIDWLICGGESGPGARRFDPEWARDLLDACRGAGGAFFMKQMGSRWARERGGRGKGGDPDRWPEDLRVREMPSVKEAVLS